MFFKMSVNSNSWLGKYCFFSRASKTDFHMEGITRTCFANEVENDPFLSNLLSFFFFFNWERLCLGCARKHDVLIIWRVHVAAPIRIFIISIMLVCTMNTSIFSNFFLNNLFLSRRQNNEI